MKNINYQNMPFVGPEVEELATKRKASLFGVDFQNRKKNLVNEVKNASVAVIGAAGSIGSGVVTLLSELPLKKLTLFDISENNLVEVTRDIRSGVKTHRDLDLQVLPIGLGDAEFYEFINTEKFQFILNFSAMKHVRSEKDIFCLRRLLRTNIFALDELFEHINTDCKKIFSVSSDKAVRPANLMGASKNIMEQVLLAHSDRFRVSTARFANVAFSDGSLPYGFLKRLQKRQPLAAPTDVKRYFISHREAAELSILSAITGNNGEVFFPQQEGNLPEVSFADIAISVLELYGFTPELCDSEEEAKLKLEELISQRRWPCLFTASDTTGEKELEEFVGPGEKIVEHLDLKNMAVAKRELTQGEIVNYREFISLYKNGRMSGFSKADFVAEINKLVPDLTHKEKNKYLDAKM